MPECLEDGNSDGETRKYLAAGKKEQRYMIKESQFMIGRIFLNTLPQVQYSTGRNGTR